MSRFFKITYASKKTQHPDGEKLVILYAGGKHKKMACENALLSLEKLEPLTFELFKLPACEEISHDQFLDAQDEIEQPPADTIESDNQRELFDLVPEGHDPEGGER